jgi:hypothetical protein
VNKEKLKDPTIVANACNKFFLTVTEKLNLQKPEKGDAISFLIDSFPGNFPSIKIIPITEAEIKSIVCSLKPKNSSGYDEVTSKILKSCASIINLPLSFICNHSIHTGIFPNRLQIAVVKPLHTKGDKFSMTKYRPISLLPIFSEVFEKVMHSRLHHHLNITNILVPEQHAFRKGMSTEDAAFRLTDSLFKSLNQKLHVGGIFCD